MDIFFFIMLTLVTWRITHLLAIEDGPFDLIFKLRKKLGDGFLANLLDCFYCLSIWIAFPFGIRFGKDLMEKLLLWLALSGAACILHKATSKTTFLNPPSYHED